jgi:hypothetical protein
MRREANVPAPLDDGLATDSSDSMIRGENSDVAGANDVVATALVFPQ